MHMIFSSVCKACILGINFLILFKNIFKNYFCCMDYKWNCSCCYFVGYGSVAASNRDDTSLAPSNRDDFSTTPESQPVDVSLVLRLQQKIKFMENDYQRLTNKFESHQALYNSRVFHHRGSGDGDSIDDLKVNNLYCYFFYLRIITLCVILW